MTRERYLAPSEIILTTNSILGIDFGKNERDLLLMRLVLFSLVYEKLLLQDDHLALDHRIASWFGKPDDFDLLKPFFDISALDVLRLPRRSFPREDLQDIAELEPLRARSIFIRDYATLDAAAFAPTQDLLDFYSLCDIQLRRRQQRFMRLDYLTLYDRFNELLRRTLERGRYRTVEHNRFDGITKAMAAEYQGFIGDPESAFPRLRKNNLPTNRVPGAPFTRSLGTRIAATYPSHQARAMRNLLQTVYSAVLCKSEDSAGRFYKRLHEYPVPDEYWADFIRDKALEVHVAFKEEIVLPRPDRLDLREKRLLIERILSLRDTDAAKAVRASMRQLGRDPEYKALREAWSGLASELAHVVADARVHKTVEIISGWQVRSAISMTLGLLVSTVLPTPDILARLGAAQITGAVSFAATSLFKKGLTAAFTEKKEGNWAAKVDNMLTIRCTNPLLPDQ